MFVVAGCHKVVVDSAGLNLVNHMFTHFQINKPRACATILAFSLLSIAALAKLQLMHVVSRIANFFPVCIRHFNGYN
jgi:hypothetical protein